MPGISSLSSRSDLHLLTAGFCLLSHPDGCVRLANQGLTTFLQLAADPHPQVAVLPPSLEATPPYRVPFACARLRTGAARRFKKAENTGAMLQKIPRVERLPL